MIRTPGDILVIGCKGSIGVYEDFMLDVLDEIDRSRRASSPRPPVPQTPVVPEVVVPPRVTDSPAASAPLNVRCKSCGAEYRLPASSVGKRFKCQKCEAVVTVGAD